MFKIINIISDKVLISTTVDIEFIEFVQLIFKENEDEDDMVLTEPINVSEAKDYINTYCDNLNLIIM